MEYQRKNSEMLRKIKNALMIKAKQQIASHIGYYVSRDFCQTFSLPFTFIHNHFLKLLENQKGKDNLSKGAGLNDKKVPRQSNSRDPVACFWSINRKQDMLLWASKECGAHRQLPTPPNE
ncbi:hypothetical protein TNIN_355621 [Trichonephila inaurata madagascariensis]|uniref:Uncharacterized protein n=1 Tax=Trichonephila inaurata madagascariensis TaxID=2747483 RepID=A0A8X6XVB6_9ARAC|nr:hypothetical protein TNIN_355621 [Trichonephila inaurata madagascariensis]